MKKEFTITHQFDDIFISQQDRDVIMSFIGWDATPTFAKAGRTAWHVLKEEGHVLSKPDIIVRAAKMKGIGLWNPYSEEQRFDRQLKGKIQADPPIPPPEGETYSSLKSYPHFGISRQGDYINAYSRESPLGGIVKSRAILEFENAKRLFEHNVSSTIPFVLAEYKGDYRFQGEPMSVVVCLSRTSDNMRLSKLLYKFLDRGQDPQVDLFYDRIRAFFGIDGDPSSEVTRLKTINKLARQIGKLVHDFAASGLYRHSSGWSNFEFDTINGQAFLTDLDSSRSLSELSPIGRTLEVMRDIAAATWRIVGRLGYPNTLGHFTLKNLISYNPLVEFFLGYFPNATYEEALEASKPLWNYFIPHFVLLNKYKDAILSEMSISQRKTYKADHDLFHVLSMRQIFPMFEKSDLFKQYPSDLTTESLDEKARKFLGSRYDYYCYLLNRNCFF